METNKSAKKGQPDRAVGAFNHGTFNLIAITAGSLNKQDEQAVNHPVESPKTDAPGQASKMLRRPLLL